MKGWGAGIGLVAVALAIGATLLIFGTGGDDESGWLEEGEIATSPSADAPSAMPSRRTRSGQSAVAKPEPVAPRSTEAAAVAVSGRSDPFGFPLAALTGRVTDREGRPIAAAEVELYEERGDVSVHPIVGQRLDSVSTNDEGVYVFAEVEASGSHQLRVVHDAYAARWIRGFAVHPGEVCRVDVTLRRGAEIMGQVTDASGAPISGATVTVIDDTLSAESEESAVERLARTNERGLYRVLGVSFGTKVVMVQADGFAVGSKPGVIVDAQSGVVAVDFVLTLGATISGRVVDAEGRGVEGAIINVQAVRLRSRGPLPRFPSTVSDVSGAFETPTLPEGLYLVRARRDGFDSRSMRNARSGDRDVEIELRRVPVVTGTVVAAGTGDPLAAFSLVASATPQLGPAAAGRARRYRADDGRFTFTLESVSPGQRRIWLFALAPGWAGGRAELELAPSDGPPVAPVDRIDGIVIQMTRGGVVTGRVTDTHGDPVGGATVALVPRIGRSDGAGLAIPGVGAGFGRASASGVCDASGVFRITGVLAGEYVLRVTHTDFAELLVSESVIVGDAGDVSVPDIRLDVGGRVTGIVRDRLHRPQEDAVVTLTPDDPRAGRTLIVRTPITGVYDFPHVVPGRYWLKVASRRGLHEPHVFDVTGAVARGIEITVRAGETVRRDL